MGKCASKCCFCVPGLSEGRKGKFEPPIQFTITATPQRNDSSKSEEDPDFVPPTPIANSGYEQEEGDDKSSSSSSSSGSSEGLFGLGDSKFDSKSLEEISLSKEMDNRSKEIMQSYQLKESSAGGTFLRPPSSSEDSCLPESIPSTHPLPKEEEDSESVLSSGSYCRRNLGFLGDEDFLIGSYHYKTEVIGEVKSVYSCSSEGEESKKQVTSNLTLIDRCMGLELNENDDVCEMTSIRFVLGDSQSLTSSPGSIDSSSLEAMFPLSLTKAQLEISDEVQTRL